MASKAGWQTTAGFGGHGACPGEHSQDQSLNQPLNRNLEQNLKRDFDRDLNPGSAAYHSMDQRTVESLLRRLVERVEESEHLYCAALDELHTRLDRLTHTTDAARQTVAPEDAETFDRVHTQVSNLARRLEDETSTPLDDFDRLGRTLTGGLRGAVEDSVPAHSGEDPLRSHPAVNNWFGTAPEPSPFARSVTAARSRTQPEPDPGVTGHGQTSPRRAQGTQQQAFDNRLVEMADRLERSIGAAMPSSMIEALNARLEEVGTQIAQSLDTAPSRTALELVEKQVSDMGQQLSRAEEQLGRLGGVEERLLTLLARLDEQDERPNPSGLDPAQLQEIAAKAAVEAARLVADDSKKTTERLEAMQRELNSVSDTSQKSDEKLAGKLQSVHESLNQLVQLVERGSAAPGPFDAPARSMPSPCATMRAPAAAEPLRDEPSRTKPAQSRPSAPDARRREPVGSKPPGPKPAGSKPAGSKPAGSNARSPKPEAPRLPNMQGAAAKPDTRQPSPTRPRSQRRSPHEAEMHVKETLRSRLGTSRPDSQPRDIPVSFDRESPASFREKAFDLDEDLLNVAPDDMVAAARRAAQAAAAQAEARGNRLSRRRLAENSRLDEQPGNGRRSLLIISAAILLVISALLLYGRLGSKLDAQVGSGSANQTLAPTGETNPSAAGAPSQAADDGAAPVPGGERSGSFMILPDPRIAPGSVFVPLKERVGQVGQSTPGVTDIPKSAPRPMPASELTPETQLAALKPEGSAALPDGVIFSIEEPVSAPQAAMAEKLTVTPVKGPMPPEALGPLPLRKAASDGDAIAQYTIAIRYITGSVGTDDPKTGAEWLERAARAGLAPAQYLLGAMYERGIGATANIDTARNWYVAAAEQGNVKAMHNLAASVRGQTGSTPNYELAAKWFGAAAARDLVDSQFNLGVLAEHGLGQSKDLAEAYKWFSLAAANGNKAAKSHRDLIRAQLAPKTLVAAETKIKTWTAEPVSPEANDVRKPTGGRTGAGSEANGAVPQAAPA